MKDWSDYFANLILALQGKENCPKNIKEAFNTYESQYIFLILPILFICGFAYNFGAGLLAYNYSVYKGDSAAILWAIIAYFFSGIYYPFYAFFLNPLNTMTPTIQITLPTVNSTRRK